MASIGPISARLGLGRYGHHRTDLPLQVCEHKIRTCKLQYAGKIRTKSNGQYHRPHPHAEYTYGQYLTNLPHVCKQKISSKSENPELHWNV